MPLGKLPRGAGDTVQTHSSILSLPERLLLTDLKTAIRYVTLEVIKKTFVVLAYSVDQVGHE
jgi:hypothetical protein